MRERNRVMPMAGLGRAGARHPPSKRPQGWSFPARMSMTTAPGSPALSLRDGHPLPAPNRQGPPADEPFSPFSFGTADAPHFDLVGF